MRALALVTLLAAGAAQAQERPSEDDLFGAPAPELPAAAEEAPGAAPRGEQEAEAPGTPPAAGDRRLDAEPGAEARLGARLARATLDVGGQLYLRAFAFSREGDPPARWTLTAPSLLDVYLDARPDERIRAFVLARMVHDPTVAPDAGAAALPGAPDASEPLPIFDLAAQDQTAVALDQMWLRFDVGRRAFVTAGKQHVKWGVGRFWNPTDFLHAVRRNPLAPFDVRTGTSMLRVQVPWEARGWSFQAATVVEPLVPARDEASATAGRLDALSGAARAELVFGTTEVGVGGVAQRGGPARLGVDVSAALWELDAYGELALRSDPEVQLWREVPGAGPSTPLVARFERHEPGGANPAATLGASWTRKYGDDDTFTVGAEYFYNRNGYDDPDIYPWLLLQGDFQPFYVGRHYAGAFLLLPGPGRWDRATFTLSALANVSDGSLLGRADLALVVLTHLRFEAFVAAHGGTDGGEFRLGVDVPPQDLGGFTTPAVQIGAPIVDLGVALRVAL